MGQPPARIRHTSLDKDGHTHIHKANMTTQTLDQVLRSSYRRKLKAGDKASITAEERAANARMSSSNRYSSPDRKYSVRQQNCRVHTKDTDVTKEFLKVLAESTPICCITGLALDYSPSKSGHSSLTDTSAELDRIDASKGYYVFNVRWISKRANRMKQDNNSETLTRLLADSLGLDYVAFASYVAVAAQAIALPTSPKLL